MRTIPKPKPAGDRRIELRFGISFRTVLIESEVSGEHIEIINIARSGFLAKSNTYREPGSTIELELPRIGAIVATVAWSANGLLGGRFLAPIDEHLFADLLDSLS